MPRPIKQIIAHIRAVAANPAISTTLIQTEDLEALCNAAEPDREKMVNAVIAAHVRHAQSLFPNGDHAALTAEMETYRPYAERDVDAIIAALGEIQTR